MYYSTVGPGLAAPQLAVLWHLQHMAFTPEAASLSPSRFKTPMRRAGVEKPVDAEVLPEMTRPVYARKLN
jgi:2-hydroxy-4-(methylsulfanyl)butanoate S-methyltransferase